MLTELHCTVDIVKVSHSIGKNGCYVIFPIDIRMSFITKR